MERIWNRFFIRDYFTTLSVRCLMNWKEFGRKRRPLGICLDGLRKVTKPPVIMAGALNKIRTQHLLGYGYRILSNSRKSNLN
jgi:hypothetical protein